MVRGSKSYPSANEIQSEVRLKVFTLKLQTLTEELTELQLTEEGESNPKVEKLQKMVDKVRALIEKEQYSLQYLQKK